MFVYFNDVLLLKKFPSSGWWFFVAFLVAFLFCIPGGEESLCGIACWRCYSIWPVSNFFPWFLDLSILLYLSCLWYFLPTVHHLASLSASLNTTVTCDVEPQFIMHIGAIGHRLYLGFMVKVFNKLWFTYSFFDIYWDCFSVSYI